MKTLLTKKTSLYQIYSRVFTVSLYSVFILLLFDVNGSLTHWFWQLYYAAAMILMVCSLLSLPSVILYQQKGSWLARMGLIINAMGGVYLCLIILDIIPLFTFDSLFDGKPSLTFALLLTIITLAVAIAHANVMQLLSNPSQRFLQAMIKLTLLLIAVLAALFLASIWVGYFASRSRAFNNRFSWFSIIYLVGGMNIVATLVTLFICSLRRKRKKRLKNH